MSLKEQAASLVPEDDPWAVGMTALPAIMAHQNRFAERLRNRSDRFSQILSRAVESKFVRDHMVTRSTLSETEKQELLDLSPSAIAMYNAEVESVMKSLRHHINATDAFLLAAQISFNHTFDGRGAPDESASEKSEVSVEVVAAIASSQPQSSEDFNWEHVQRVEDLLEELRFVQLARDIADGTANQEEGHLRLVGRTHLANIRGDAYPHHGADLARAILSPAQSAMRAEFGFSIEEYLHIAERLTEYVVDRVNSHRLVMMELIEKAQNESRAGRDSDPSSLRAAYDEFWIKLPRCLLFGEEELVRVSGVGAAIVQRFLSELSIVVGQLDSSAYTSLMDAYPLTYRPLLRRGDNYIVPVPGQLFRSCHELFEPRLLARNPNFAKQRAQVLDHVATRLLADSLPGARFGNSLLYTFDDGDGIKQFEVDGLVVFDRFCLILEGKAGSISLQSRRGDLRRLGRDLARSIGDGWAQCARVERFLQQSSPVEFTDASRRVVLSVDNPGNLETLFVNPLIHSLGGFAHQLPLLSEQGLLPAGCRPWPITVTDLRVIAELTNGPAELLHFMRWRSLLSIGTDIDTVDELDIFATYLFGRVGRATPGPRVHQMLSSATEDFDNFYAGETGRGPTTERPGRDMGPVLADVLTDLSVRRPRGWLDLSFAILDLGLSDIAFVWEFLVQNATRLRTTQRFTAGANGKVAVVLLAESVRMIDVLFELPATSRGSTLLVFGQDGRRPVLVHSSQATEDSL